MLGISGGKKTEHGYERRINSEVYESFQEPTIVNFVKARRLKWLGHIALARIYGTVPNHGRKRGKSKKR